MWLKLAIFEKEQEEGEKIKQEAIEIRRWWDENESKVIRKMVRTNPKDWCYNPDFYNGSGVYTEIDGEENNMLGALYISGLLGFPDQFSRYFNLTNLIENNSSFISIDSIVLSSSLKCHQNKYKYLVVIDTAKQYIKELKEWLVKPPVYTLDVQDENFKQITLKATQKIIELIDSIEKDHPELKQKLQYFKFRLEFFYDFGLKDKWIDLLLKYIHLIYELSKIDILLDIPDVFDALQIINKEKRDGFSEKYLEQFENSIRQIERVKNVIGNHDESYFNNKFRELIGISSLLRKSFKEFNEIKFNNVLEKLNKLIKEIMFIPSLSDEERMYLDIGV